MGFWLMQTDVLIAERKKPAQSKWAFRDISRLEDLVPLVPEGSSKWGEWESLLSDGV